jgi:hypothetical protein
VAVLFSDFVNLRKAETDREQPVLLAHRRGGWVVILGAASFAEGGSWNGIAFKAYEPPLMGAERGNPAQAQDLNGSGPIGKALRNPLLGHLQIGKCGMA